MSQEDATIRKLFNQYLRKEYLTRLVLATVIVIIVALIIQGLTRFKGKRLFKGLISISIRSTIIETITIFIPHLILFILIYILFRQFFSKQKLNNIGPKTRFIMFFIIVSSILFMYAFQFIVPQSSENQFIFSQHEWLVTNESTPRTLSLANQSITITPGTNFFFTIQRPVRLDAQGNILIPPYKGTENGTFRVDSLEIQVSDNELAESFGLKIGNQSLGFLLSPIDWADFYNQLKEVNPEITANFSVIFPEEPRDDFLAGNVTRVVTFSTFENDTTRNITVSYDEQSGVLVHALIIDTESVLELVLVSSDDVEGFKLQTIATQPMTNTTTTPTTSLNTSGTKALITSLPISNQQLTSLIVLTFLLATPLIIMGVIGLYYLRSKKEKNIQESEENITSTLNNLKEIDNLPLKEQIIQRYRLATRMLEDMGAPEKDSLTPTEFEEIVSRMFGDAIKDDFLILSRAFKLAKFEEDRRLSPIQLKRLAMESKISFKRINDVYIEWLQKIEELESREEEWE